MSIGFEWGYQPLTNGNNISNSDNNNNNNNNNNNESGKLESDAKLEQSGALPKSYDQDMNKNMVALLAKYKSNSGANRDTKKRSMEDSKSETSSSLAAQAASVNIILPRKKIRNAYHYKSASDSVPVGKKQASTTAAGQTQSLPINRVLELLDKTQVDNIILKLVNQYPELNECIYKECYYNNSITNVVDSMILKIDNKFEMIISNVPFSKSNADNENLNDYCFERVKPHLLEFLNCCYEYTQSLELGNREQWRLMDHILTQLHKLPVFSNRINNYYTDFCIEQMDKTFHKSLLSTGNDDWVYLFGDRLLKHCNSIGNDKLKCLSALINETYHRTTFHEPPSSSSGESIRLPSKEHL